MYIFVWSLAKRNKFNGMLRRFVYYYLYTFIFQVETSFMTFEGVQLQGAVKIMEKLNVRTLSLS